MSEREILLTHDLPLVVVSRLATSEYESVHLILDVTDNDLVLIQELA